VPTEPPVLDGTLFGPDQQCFGCGPAHPSGFRLSFTEEGEDLVTRFTPTGHHQGPPGLMHGGLVFTLADELAAWAIIARFGKFGFTARFAGKLQKPTRVGVEITGRARVVRSTGRTAEIEVRLSQGEVQVYESTFTFVVLAREATEKLIGGPLPEGWTRFSR
jgi:acyl-coenzyme A thioesterase PaaI-like protein